MKILAFSDLHGDSKGMINIINKLEKEKPDLLICTGDITDFGRGLDKIVNKLNSFNIPFLIIPGNHEFEAEIRLLAKKYKNVVYLHKKFHNHKDYLFFGFGGYGFSMRIPEFENFVNKNKEKFKNKKIIFLAHAPIYNTKLDFLKGIGYKGCIDFRRFIEEFKPVLVLCGHFHENEKKIDFINKTKIINPGFEGMIIEV